MTGAEHHAEASLITMDRQQSLDVRRARGMAAAIAQIEADARARIEQLLDSARAATGSVARQDTPSSGDSPGT